MEKKEIKSVLLSYANKVGKAGIFAGIFIFGYICSDVYHRIKNKETSSIEKSTPKITKTISKVSVAINERNELMIIDRTDGRYEIYQDSVGRCIFNLYANSIQTKYQNP